MSFFEARSSNDIWCCLKTRFIRQFHEKERVMIAVKVSHLLALSHKHASILRNKNQVAKKDCHVYPHAKIH